MAPALATLLALPALAGIAYTLFAAAQVRAFGRRVPAAGAPEPVTLLKPLHGAEPRLAENLATFLDQDWPAPIQLVAGIQRPDDPAIAVVEAMARPEIVPVIDPTPHGANGKVANLLNIAGTSRHDLVVVSDSDMAVPRDYLRILAGALAEPGVGAATCIYRGRGDAGRWSALAAAGISYHFIPQLAVGLALGLARPGMGSTIALRREVLEAIGGFAPFADALADDYALGEAVRGLGLAVVVPPLLLVHGCTERSFGEIWRHELRWAATILAINPGGWIGTIVSHPLVLALALVPFRPTAGLALALAALAARLLLKREVDRLAGTGTAPAWLLPARDLLSFAVFAASFVARSVDWRGQRLVLGGQGRVARRPESSQ